MSNYSNELDEFIYEKCYSRIWEAVYTYIATYPMSFSGNSSRLMYPVEVVLSSMLLQFSSNISADEDALCFDATFSCSITLHGDDCSSHDHHFKWWFGFAPIRGQYLQHLKGGAESLLPAASR